MTLEELMSLLADGGMINRKTVESRKPLSVSKVTMPKKKRTKSAWQRYMSQKKNQIKFKSGSKKGLLNMKAMARKFKKTPAGKKRKGRK